MKVPKGWDVLPLGDLLTVCQYGLSEPTSADGNLAIVGMKDLGDGRVNFDNLQVMRSNGVDIDKFRLRPGDILFNRTNSADLVGKTALVVELSKTAVFASYLVRLCVDVGRTTPEFVNAYLNSPSGQGRVKRLATRGVSQANINPTTLRNHLYIPVPPLGEQRRIAEILGAWDEAIEKVQALIQAKQKLKRALMHQLLTPTRRFPQFKGTWRTVALSALYSKRKGTAVPVQSEPAKYQFIGSRAMSGEEEGWTGSPGVCVLPQDLLILWDGEYAGKVAYGLSGVIGSTVAALQPKGEAADTRFVGAVMQLRNGRIRAITEGSGIPHCPGDLLDWFKLGLPERNEQSRISDVLDAAHHELMTLRLLCKKLELQKRGLMQKLLTGQIRVKEALDD